MLIWRGTSVPMRSMMLSGNEARCILMQAKLKRSRRAVALVMTAALLAIGATTAMASTTGAPAGPAAAAPINDNYLNALNLNEPPTQHHPGTPLNRTETLRDERNTAAATVQSNILSPHPGEAELTGCNGVTEGKTIWYDFYPNANGLVRIRTSASFGTVMAVMPYNPTTLLPENEQRKCAVNQPTVAGELFANVQAGKSYTIQLGGVNGRVASSSSCSTTSSSSSSCKPKRRSLRSRSPMGFAS